MNELLLIALERA